MGLDITIYREEILSRDIGKGETIIKRNNMYEAKGWELGDFLIETFDIENCVPQIIEPEEALAKVKQELKDLEYQPTLGGYNNISQEWVDGYVDNLKNMVAVLTEAVNEEQNESGFKGMWEWELSW